MKVFGSGCALLLALAACSPNLSIPDGAVIACAADGSCPTGRFCRNNLCVTTVDDVLPDLAAAPTVTPAVGKSGATFALEVVSTKALAAPPQVTLALSPPVELACSLTSAMHYACSYQATGAENDGLGGVIPFDVKLVDTSGNVTSKHLAGALELDFTAPVVAAKTLSPAVAKLGAPLQVFFTSSEALSANPVLHVTPGLVEGGTLKTDFPLAPEGATLNYRFEHTIDAADPAGTLTFTVSLADLAGNTASASALGTVTLDNTLPVLSAAQLTPAVARDATVIAVSFDIDKPLAALPTVTLGGVAMDRDSAAVPPHYRFTHTAAAADGDGPKTVLVNATDLAGNALSRDLGTVTDDFQAPVVAAKTLSPAIAKLGASLQVFFSSSEPLSANPVLHVVPGVFDHGVLTTDFPLSPEGSTLNYRFDHSVVAADPAGTLTFSVSLIDVAGNSTSSAALGTVTIDNTLPVLSAAVVTPTVARAATVVSVTFDIDKPMAAIPSVTLGGVAMDPQGAVTPPHYLYTHTATPADGDGPKTVLVNATDLAGNALSRDLGTVTDDFQTPAVVSTTVTPAIAQLGANVLYSISTTEPLASPPILHVGGQTSLFAYRAGTSYVFEHVITSADTDGTHAVTIDLTDLAGNATTGAPGVSVVVDKTSPTITNVTLNHPRFSAQPGFSHVDLAFDASESLDVAPAQVGVWLQGPGGAVSQQMTCSQYDSGLSRYTCTYDVTGSEAEGNWIVSIIGRDAAGNQVYASTSAVLDFTGPQVLSALGNPNPAKLDSVIVVSVAVDEQLGAQPILTAQREGGTEQLAFNYASGTTYAFSHRVTFADTPGDYRPSLSMVDLVGNSATVTGPDPFAVDPVPPDLSNLTVSLPRIRPGATVDVSFDVNQQLAVGGLSASIGGFGMSCDPYQATSPNYTCHYTAAGTETLADTESPALVLLVGRDDAGNSNALTGSAVWDFKAPRVVSTSITLLPGAGNLLDTVTAATVGTKVHVTLVSDEALDTGVIPTLTVTEPVSGASAGTFSPIPGTLTPFGVTFSGLIAAGAVTGDNVLQVGWSDLAGNAALPASFATPVTIPVKVEASPMAPPTQVTFHRSPLGNGAAELLSGGAGFLLPPGPFFELAPDDPLFDAQIPGTAFLVDGSPSPRIRVWKEANKVTLIGSASYDQSLGGYLRPRLALSSDLGQVFVSGTDRAGNESDAVPVNQVELVASPGNYTAVTPPHTLTSDPIVSLRRDPDSAAASPAPTGAEGADGSALVVAAKTEFRLQPGGTLTTARSGTAIAYDSARGRLVAFGGDTGSGTYIKEPWIWDGGGWTPLPNFGAPGARGYASMTYDSRRDRILLFGGSTSAGPVNELYSYDAGLWTPVTFGFGPGPRSSAAMTFDARRGRAVLVGGEAGAGAIDEIWEWDGTQWFDLSGVSPRPPKRSRASIAYDPERGRVILFGGQGASGPLQDLWEWDGTSWTQVFPTTPPPARAEAGMAFDPIGHRLLIYGGVDGSGPRGDLWGGSGTTWAQLTATGPAPTARKSAAVAFDPVSGRLFVIGGEDSGGRSAETWAWDGVGWEGPLHGPPPARNYAAMATDTGRRRAMLFGGESSLDDTWEWDGLGWNQLSPIRKPTPRGQAAMAYDASRQRMVLFGGLDINGALGDVWEFNGTTWNDVSPPGTDPQPGPRHDMAAGYDPVRQKMVIYGGDPGSAGALGDVWLWDGFNFTEQTFGSPNPGARRGARMVWSPALSKLVLFGGIDGFGNRAKDTWGLDATGWTLLSAGDSKSPAGRTDHLMAFDASSGRVVMFGGSTNGTSGVDDLWEFTGSQWISRQAPPGPTNNIAGSPTKHRASAMATSPNGQVLLFGAADGTPEVPQTWLLDAPGTQQPAAMFTVKLAGLVPATATVTTLELRADCGGLSDGTSSPGVSVFGWSLGGPISFAPGAWQQLTNGTSGIGSGDPLLPLPPGARLGWTAVDPSEFISGDRKLFFQCRPTSGTHGNATEATVALDYIEARVRYTLP